MKKSLYSKSIETIKAPENLVEKSIHTLYNDSVNSEANKMKKTKHFKLKLTSAIAASLVIILAFSVIMYGGNDETNPQKSKPVSHPFIISVQAADSPDDTTTPDEITHEAYVKIGKIKNSGEGVGGRTHGYFNDNDEYILIDDYLDLLYIEKDFTLELNCTGENIESITYTAQNTYLTYMPWYEGFIDAVQLTDEERKAYNAYSSVSYGPGKSFDWASSCTFDYDCQPKSSLDYEIDEDSSDGTIPLKIAFYLELEDGKYVIPSIDECDVASMFEEEFNARSDKYALDVTANFKDGTSTTKTLKFKCEKKGNQVYLCAIEDNS